MIQQLKRNVQWLLEFVASIYVQKLIYIMKPNQY